MSEHEYLVAWCVVMANGEIKLFSDRVNAWHFYTWSEGCEKPRKVGLTLLQEAP